MSSSALANRPPHARSVFSLVPGHRPIELVAYYSELVDYYPECELQTKRWFVENMGRDWVSFDVGANVGYYSILFSRLAPAGRVYAFEPTETIELLQKNLAYHASRNVEPIKSHWAPSLVCILKISLESGQNRRSARNIVSRPSIRW